MDGWKRFDFTLVTLTLQRWGKKYPLAPDKYNNQKNIYHVLII